MASVVEAVPTFTLIFLQARLEQGFNAKLVTLEKKHAEALDEQSRKARCELEEQMRAIKREHEATLKEMQTNYEATLRDVKAAATAAAVAETEQRLKPELEQRIEQIKSSHQQATEQMHEHHHRSIAQLEGQLGQVLQNKRDLEDSHRRELEQVQAEKTWKRGRDQERS